MQYLFFKQKAQHAILRFAKHKAGPTGALEAHHERTKEQYATIDYLTQENEGLQKQVNSEKSIQKQMEVLMLKKENEQLRRFVQRIPPEVRQALKEQQQGQRRGKDRQQ